MIEKFGEDKFYHGNDQLPCYNVVVSACIDTKQRDCTTIHYSIQKSFCTLCTQLNFYLQLPCPKTSSYATVLYGVCVL